MDYPGMRKDTWRSIMAIYLILGVLCLVACVSIAISNNGAGADSNIDGPEESKDLDINIGDNDND